MTPESVEEPLLAAILVEKTSCEEKEKREGEMEEHKYQCCSLCMVCDNNTSHRLENFTVKK